MALIGSLAVNVVANTQKWSSGLGKARKDLKGFDGAVKSVQSSLKSFAVAGAAALGFAGIGATVGKVLKDVDELAKAASRLKLPVAELQAFRYAADLSGVSSELVTKSIGMLTRKASEAAIGIGEAKNVIAELGLDAQKLAATAPEKQLAVIAERMQGLARSDQIRISSKLFGEEGGVAMISLLKDGAAGLAKMRDEFMKTGAAVSDADAKKIEEFNDAFAKLKTIAGGFIRSFVIDVTPAAIKVVEELQRIFTDLRSGKRETAFGKFMAGEHSSQALGRWLGTNLSFLNPMAGIDRYRSSARGVMLDTQRAAMNLRNRDRWEEAQLKALRSIDQGIRENQKPPVVLQGAGL